jgi:hypothetical protein
MATRAAPVDASSSTAVTTPNQPMVCERECCWIAFDLFVTDFLRGVRVVVFVRESHVFTGKPRIARRRMR